MQKSSVSRLVLASLFLTFLFILIFYSITYNSVKSTIDSSRKDSLDLVIMRNLEGVLDEVSNIEELQREAIIFKKGIDHPKFQKSILNLAENSNRFTKIGDFNKLWKERSDSLTFFLSGYNDFIRQQNKYLAEGNIAKAESGYYSEESFLKLSSLKNYVKKLEAEGRENLKISAEYKESEAGEADILFRIFGVIVLVFLVVLYFRTSYDLRKRSELELKLQDMNDELSHRVNQKTSELREKNEQLNLFLEHSPAALAMFDNDMRYLVVSKKWLSDFNLGTESIIGRSHYEIFPAVKDWWRDVHQRALQGEIVTGSEDMFVRNDGQLEWKKWDAYPWFTTENKIGGIIIFAQIITEQKIAQERLKIHDALLSRSEEMGKFGCWETDFHIEKTECSEAYYQLTGLPREEGTSLNKFKQIVHPEDRLRFETEVEQFYKQPGNYFHSFRIITSRGEIKYIHSSLEVYYSSQGKLMRAFGVMQDMTTQHDAEEILRASEEKYRMLVEQADDGIIVCNNDGVIFETNPAFCNLLGKSRQETLKENFHKLIVPLTGKEASFHDDLSDGKKIDLRRIFKKANGEVLTVSIHAKKLPTGMILVFIRDITENLANSKALLESENKFRAIFESEPECVKLMDDESRIWDMNPAGLAMIEADGIDDIRGKSALGIVNPEFKEAYEQMTRDIFNGKIVTLQFEITTLKGNRKILETQCVPLKNSEQKVIANLSVTRDISERILAEQKLAASEARFRSIIEQFPYPVASYDNNGYMISTNKAWEELWQAGKEDFVDYNILHDPIVSQAGMMESVQLAFKGEIIEGGPLLYEPAKTGKSGASRNIIATLFPLKTPAGEVLEVIEIVQDVTEKMKAQEELKQSEEKYRTLVDEANDGIFIADNTGKFIVVNPSGSKLSQFSFEELKNMTIYDLVVKEDLIKHPFRFDEMHSGKVVRSERRMRRKDGSILYVDISAKFITDTRFLAFVRDITEAKKAQEDIRKSNDRFNLIANSTNDALYEWNLDTNEIWWSESHYRMFGYDPSKPIPTQEDWIKRIHPDDRFLLYKQLDEAINGSSEHAQSVIRHLLPDGTYGTLLQRCIMVHDETHPKGLLVGSFVDITARIKIEEELQLKEKAIATSISGMGMADLNGNITYANETLWKMWGFQSREELIGKHLTEVFKGERIYQTMNNLKSKGFDHGEDIGVRSDGSLMNVAFSANVITAQDGSPICLFGSFLDITDKKKAEDAIRQSEIKYRLLFDLSPLPKFVFDEKTLMIVDVNKAAITHYGFSRDQILTLKILDVFPASEHSRILKALSNNGETNHNRHWKNINSKNEIMTVEIFSHKLVYNNRPSWLILANDITQSIEQKELLEQTTQQLRQLAAHLQEVREEERTSIAREIHDEMGQQLTALRMDLSFLKKRCEKSDAITMKKIDSTIEQVDRTIQSIRRIATDLHPGILEDLGLAAALEWQAQEFQNRTGIATEFVDQTNDLKIDKNTSRAMFRIFQESLTNIAKHSEAKKAEAILEVENDSLCLSIKDNGKGFDQKELSHKKTLGLLSMKERVTLMNGKYSLESKPMGGTEITVTVPLNDHQSN